MTFEKIKIIKDVYATGNYTIKFLINKANISLDCFYDIIRHVYWNEKEKIFFPKIEMHRRNRYYDPQLRKLFGLPEPLYGKGKIINYQKDLSSNANKQSIEF